MCAQHPSRCIVVGVWACRLPICSYPISLALQAYFAHTAANLAACFRPSVAVQNGRAYTRLDVTSCISLAEQRGQQPAHPEIPQHRTYSEGRLGGADDKFRSRFLWGRKPMLAACAARVAEQQDLVWVDLGGGTGVSIPCMSRV